MFATLKRRVAKLEAELVAAQRSQTTHPAQYARPTIGGGGGGMARCYKIKSVEADYLKCHTWDGTTEGDDFVAVAKYFRLQRKPFHATGNDALGLSYQYSSDGTQRVVDHQGQTQPQNLVPAYQVNHLIAAFGINFTGVTAPKDFANPTGEQVSVTLMEFPMSWFAFFFTGTITP